MACTFVMDRPRVRVPRNYGTSDLHLLRPSPPQGLWISQHFPRSDEGFKECPKVFSFWRSTMMTGSVLATVAAPV